MRALAFKLPGRSRLRGFQSNSLPAKTPGLTLEEKRDFYFETGCCPNCSENDWNILNEKKGHVSGAIHDIECNSCGAQFNVVSPYFFTQVK